MRRPLALLALAVLAPLAGAAPAGAADPPPEPRVVADGVTIAGLDVAGLTRLEAQEAVRAWFDRPVKLRFRGRTLRAKPTEDLRARARAGRAAWKAIAAEPGKELPLGLELRAGGIDRYVAKLAARLDRAPKNSRLVLRNLRPRITEAKYGWRIVQPRLKASLRKAIWTHRRGPVGVHRQSVAPNLTRADFAPAIVIRRGSKRLYLYGKTELRRTFGVATGLPQYPTPLGRFSIVTMQRNPWWYPPDSDWAAGAEPIPPGPGNPLGTRWMGLSASGIGIHGTPDAASIGTSASHGCIRMRIPEAEWLFERVRLGTTVFIVSA